MKKDVITLEKITYKNYVKVLFGLNETGNKRNL